MGVGFRVWGVLFASLRDSEWDHEVVVLHRVMQQGYLGLSGAIGSDIGLYREPCSNRSPKAGFTFWPVTLRPGGRMLTLRLTMKSPPRHGRCGKTCTTQFRLYSNHYRLYHGILSGARFPPSTVCWIFRYPQLWYHCIVEGMLFFGGWGGSL